MESLGNEVFFMNIDALFCDGTGNYVIPPEPKKNEKIRLRFRTAKDDVDQVFLLVGEQSYEMEKRKREGYLTITRWNGAAGRERIPLWISGVQRGRSKVL